jgi:hypothetical protein
MPVTVNVNGLSLVHQGSTGIAMATTPDVCLTPSFGPPVPIPYPNIAMSMDLLLGSLMVKADGGMMVATLGCKFWKSTGDEPGVAGGVVSHLFIGPASFISASPTVLMEGKPACRLTDKMLMNLSNTVCMGGVLQNPVPAGPDIPMSKEPVFCVFKDLTMKCAHADRKYKAIAAKDVRLAVIAAKKSETVNFTYEATCGVTRSSPGCGRLEVKGPDGVVAMNGPTAVELPMPRSAGVLERSWTWLFRYVIFPRNVPTDIYTVKSYTCAGQGGCSVLTAEYGVIEVYPNVGWSGEVKMTYKPEREKAMVAGKERATLELDQNAAAEWEFEGKFEAEYGTGKLTFTPKTKYDVGPAKDADPLTQGIFKGTQRFLNGFAWLFNSLLKGGVIGTLSIEAIEFGFGGGVKLIEDDEGKEVVTEGSIWFGADTIIGVTVEADVLDWIILIAGAGALGSFLVKVKKLASEGVDVKIGKAKAVIKIALSLTAKLGGKVGWKGVKGKWEVDPEAAFIEAGGGAKLMGIVQGEFRIWKIVSAGAGASIGLMSADGKQPCGFSGKIMPADPKSKKPSSFPIRGVVEFTGLAVYYALYAEVGVGGAEAEKAPPGAAKVEKPYGDWGAGLKRREEKLGKLAELIAPRTWPESDKSDLTAAVQEGGGGGH